MPKFDAQLAKAELYRFEVLMHHHLRQLRLNRDYETAQHFHRTMQGLSTKTMETAGKIRRERREEK